MKTVKVSWPFGQFLVSAEADITPEQQAIIDQEGVLQVLQRVPASTAEKKLAEQGFCGKWETGKKGGLIRPKDFKRSSIEFSQETAEILAAGFGKDAEIAKGVKMPIRITGVTKNEQAAASPMVRATAFVQLMLETPETEKNMRTTFLALGYAKAMDAEEEELVAFANSKGFGVDPRKL